MSNIIELGDKKSPSHFKFEYNPDTFMMDIEYTCIIDDENRIFE